MTEDEYEMFQWPRLRGFKHAGSSTDEKIDLFLNICMCHGERRHVALERHYQCKSQACFFFFIIYFCSSLICIMHYDTRNQEGPYLHRLVFELPRRHGGGVCYLPIF